MGEFDIDKELEKEVYNRIVKPIFTSQNIIPVYINYEEKKKNIQNLQKESDIDVFIEKENKTITISLKAVKNIYSCIFFETISNMNINTKGYGYYSKADKIWYTMVAEYPSYEYYKIIIFNPSEVRNKLDIEKYRLAYGETKNDQGKILYRTEGRLIPIKDIQKYCQCKIIENTRQMPLFEG